MKNFFLILFLFSSLIIPQKRALTVEDLWNMKRIGAFDVSPDEKTVVFSYSFYSMEENKGFNDIYLIDADGKNLRPLKNSAAHETSPRFSADGKKIYYLNGSQIHRCNPDGSSDEQITDIYSGVDDFEVSADQKNILFISQVYPECNDQDCVKKRDEEKEKSKVKAEIFDELMYRHWNGWRGEKRGHLFVYNLDKKEYKDLTLNSTSDVPPIALGSANDYNFSPDGNEVSYTTNLDKFLATSTNNDVFVNALNGGTAKKISTSQGNDNQPVYSPDGKYLMFSSMARAGFEADKLDLILVDRATGKSKNLTSKWGLSTSEFIWSPDSKSVFFVADYHVSKSIFRLNIETQKVDTILNKHDNSDLEINEAGTVLYFKQQRTNLPTEIFTYDIAKKELRQITEINKELLAQLEMNSLESFWSPGAGGTKVQSILVKPPFFDPNKKYPMVFLIHGGPQGAWSDDFHYRWNPQMFAAQGYVVVATNPRGSTGYGQKFTDEISGDWGGKPYTDLMNAYDYAIKNYNFIDKNNTFAAGASYGGYMINWIAGHTDRFTALVSHAGVFNLESMYGTTEELWFTEWENKGTPWTNREAYEKFSPHRYIHKSKTPMLVVHGAYDFRVPEEQAFQLFTSLQRLGIESKFLYFPDEFHFVVKPQNAKLWWNTVFDWFNKHKKVGK